ncbi:MAG: hypothetical protein WC701_07020 [Kiritimatiellales bacterium]|jgi:hypothetical protein
MKKRLQITAAWILLAMVVHAEYVTLGGKRVWAGYATAKATIRAVDSDDLPVADANVDARLFNSKYKDMEINLSGKTDSNGCFVVEGKTTLYLTWTINKPGFYSTRGRYEISETARKLTNEVIDGKWQPWNPTLTTVVKQIRNPIPMYAKKIRSSIPVGIEVGFDFEKGDWVSPRGRGQNADITLCVKRSLTNNIGEVSYTARFTNALDGVRTLDYKGGESDFKSDYRAQNNGYLNSFSYFYQRGSERYSEKYMPNANGMYFRVRSSTNTFGEVTNAYFGKFYGHVEIGGFHMEEVRVEMLYYLNPTSNDRNLEFDPRKNLFTNLGEFEQVYEP